MTRVIHALDAEFGWWGDPAYAYVGRAVTSRYGVTDLPGSPLANPFKLTKSEDRALVVRLYRSWFLRKVESDPEFLAAVEAVRGRTLVCWCAPLACHADVVAAWLDARP